MPPANDPSDDSGLPLDQALDWFIRLQGDGAGDEDRRACAAWCAADPRNARAWTLAEALWDSPLLTGALAAPESLPEQAPRPAPSPPIPVRPAARRPVTRRPLAWAAAVLVALGLGWAADLPVRIQADHRTATGVQDRVTLADGSRVLLDTGSAIATDLAGPGRQTRLLRGAAFFEVTPDAARPFRVEAGPATVTVVGTAFAVRYLDGRVTVTVRHGTVDVAPLGGPPVRLQAGEEVAVTPSGIGAGHPADLAAALGWADGRLVFEDRPLGAVLAELDRYHRGLIVVPDTLAARRITGNYRLDDPARTAAALAGLVHADLVQVSDALLILRPRP